MMKSIEADKKTDGRFVWNDQEARAQLYIFDKVDQLVETLTKEIESLDPSMDAEKISFLSLELDLLREKMQILSEVRRQMWAFDFESDQDEV